jgi:nitrate/nitrite transporter NarK
MPISWNACVDIGGSYTATVAATMNMLGNLAGFVAPVIGGVILQRTGGHWNPLLYLMVGSSTISALCWLYLNPHSQNDPQNKNPAISVNNLQQAADIETESL